MKALKLLSLILLSLIVFPLHAAINADKALYVYDSGEHYYLPHHFGVHTPYGILVTILKDDSTISYRLLKADGTVKDIPLENISSKHDLEPNSYYVPTVLSWKTVLIENVAIDEIFYFDAASYTFKKFEPYSVVKKYAREHKGPIGDGGVNKHIVSWIAEDENYFYFYLDGSSHYLRKSDNYIAPHTKSLSGDTYQVGSRYVSKHFNSCSIFSMLGGEITSHSNFECSDGLYFPLSTDRGWGFNSSVLVSYNNSYKFILANKEIELDIGSGQGLFANANMVGDQNNIFFLAERGGGVSAVYHCDSSSGGCSSMPSDVPHSDWNAKIVGFNGDDVFVIFENDMPQWERRTVAVYKFNVKKKEKSLIFSHDDVELRKINTWNNKLVMLFSSPEAFPAIIELDLVTSKSRKTTITTFTNPKFLMPFGDQIYSLIVQRLYRQEDSDYSNSVTAISKLNRATGTFAMLTESAEGRANYGVAESFFYIDGLASWVDNRRENPSVPDKLYLKYSTDNQNFSEFEYVPQDELYAGKDFILYREKDGNFSRIDKNGKSNFLFPLKDAISKNIVIEQVNGNSIIIAGEDSSGVHSRYILNLRTGKYIKLDETTPLFITLCGDSYITSLNDEVWIYDGAWSKVQSGIDVFDRVLYPHKRLTSNGFIYLSAVAQDQVTHGAEGRLIQLNCSNKQVKEVTRTSSTANNWKTSRDPIFLVEQHPEKSTQSVSYLNEATATIEQQVEFDVNSDARVDLSFPIGTAHGLFLNIRTEVVGGSPMSIPNFPSNIFSYEDCVSSKLDPHGWILCNAERKYTETTNRKVILALNTETKKYYVLEFDSLNKFSGLRFLSYSNGGYNVASQFRQLGTEVAWFDLSCIEELANGASACKSRFKNRPPTLSQEFLKAAVQYQELRIPIPAIDADFDKLTYQLTSPSWLSVDNNGIISGTVPAAVTGSVTVTFSVNDGQTSVPGSFTFTVYKNDAVAPIDNSGGNADGGGGSSTKESSGGAFVVAFALLPMAWLRRRRKLH